jgi:hypothetical protein
LQPQVSCAQSIVQHSQSKTHALPSGRQPHWSWAHRFEQQSSSKVHAAPSAAQPHWFCEHMSPQQSWSEKQFWPLGVHPGGPQTPLSHCWSQQSVFIPQLSPFGAQEGMPELLLCPAPPVPVIMPPVPVIVPPVPDPVVLGVVPEEAIPLPDAGPVELPELLDGPPTPPAPAAPGLPNTLSSTLQD